MRLHYISHSNEREVIRLHPVTFLLVKLFCRERNFICIRFGQNLNSFRFRLKILIFSTFTTQAKKLMANSKKLSIAKIFIMPIFNAPSAQ